jgi:leader peptidase (prepilin peptidase)/N-methyltransferase
MPRGISLINPPSHCPLCKKRIPIRYNLPIVGWLWLRGKSAFCKQPISVIYPIGESLCGLLGALALYAAVGFGTDFSRPVLSPVIWADAAAMFWLLLGAYPVCAIDCKYKLIPDSISVGGIVAGLLISLVPGGVTPLQSLIGAVVAGGGLYLLGWIATKVLKKDAMGFGDVKLLAGYGALMGVTGAVETLLVAALLGIVVMVPYGVLAAKKSAQNKNSEDAGQIPFGPFLAIAAPVIYLWGSALLDAYFKYVLN